MQALQYTTVTSGTVALQDTMQDVQLVHDAGATITLTVAFPANPFNCQVVSIASNAGITTLTLTAAIGTILNAITTMLAGGVVKYMYLSATTKWYKI